MDLFQCMAEQSLLLYCCSKWLRYLLYTVHGKNLEWEKIGNSKAIHQFFTRQLFIINCICTCSSVADILPSNCFRLAHSPIFYILKFFPCTVIILSSGLPILIIPNYASYVSRGVTHIDTRTDTHAHIYCRMICDRGQSKSQSIDLCLINGQGLFFGQRSTAY